MQDKGADMDITERPIVPTDIDEAGSSILDAPESLKERLRRQRDENLTIQELVLALPEYKDPELVAKYHFLDPHVLGKMGIKVRQEFKENIDRTLWGSVDSIIECCAGLYARLENEDELIPLDPDIPMTYDTRLADYLGIEGVETARQVVYEVFGRNPYAIIQHAMNLQRWMSDRSVDLDDGLGGM
jgi:hypothetical protein